MSGQVEFSPEEIKDLARLGLFETKCAVCKKVTFYKPSKQRPVPPATCGRRECMEKIGGNANA